MLNLIKTSREKFIPLIFASLIFCALLSCAKKPLPRYVLSTDPKIQALEIEDHKFCNSLDLNSGSSNKNFNGELYWRCRLSMAKYKLHVNFRAKSDINYNAKITDLINQISAQLLTTRESSFIKENKKLDERDHQKCLNMGYDFNLSDRFKADQYLLCRKRLLDEDQLDPAFGVEEYLKYPNRSYNLSFILDNRIEIEVTKYQELEKNYPTCLKFFNKADDLKKCIAAQENSKKCAGEIDAKKFKKEAEQKTICQKQAYVRFPDSLLQDADQRKLDIKRTKANADIYNQNNFRALGIMDDDIELFESEETAKSAKEKLEKQKKLEKNINSKKGLYSRYDLIRMRQRYIYACQQNADGELKKYNDSLKQECEDAAKYEPEEQLI